MPDIKEQKLIYHLTSLENMLGILNNGLLPRSQLQDFKNVADQVLFVVQWLYKKTGKSSRVTH